MREHRRFLRVNYLGSGWLHHNAARYNCRLENISKTGALVMLKNETDISLHPGDKCTLMLHQEDKEQLYQEFDSRIIRFESGIAALTFTETSIASNDLLDDLIQKELHFINGARKLIDLGWEIAYLNGIGLTVMHFDKGELNLEREFHTLRLSTGDNSVNVHLHREEIESFHALSDAGHVSEKICHAIEQLSGY